MRDRDTIVDLPSFQVGDIACIEVGAGPLVLALHGWGGRPAQMVPPARALADAGYRVVIPELPGHAGDRATDIKQAAAAVREIVAKLGMPEIVLAHSFAAMVMRLAFEDEAPPTMVLFAPVLDVNDALSRFGDQLRLFPWARRGLRRRLEAWDPVMWPKVSGILPGQFPHTEIIVFHDPEDTETPFGRSAELTALRPGTDLRVVEGVGHTRILSDRSVLDALVRSTRTVTSP